MQRATWPVRQSGAAVKSKPFQPPAVGIRKRKTVNNLPATEKKKKKLLKITMIKGNKECIRM